MVLGIDIGGTNVKFGVVDENYNILKSYQIPTQKDKTDKEFVSAITRQANEIKKEFEYDSIGIGSPGTIDTDRGVIVRASNLPFKNTPVADMVRENLGVPVRIANDATCAVCGELYAGEGRKYDNFLMVTLGTGVGGGIVIDKKPYFGKLGRAGEFGHIIIQKDGLPCPCGQDGCLEQYASVTALIRQTERMAKAHPDSILAKMCDKGINGKTVFDAAEKGCNAAKKVIDRYTDYIAIGIQSLTRAFQPELVIIGGAISGQKENLTLPLKEKVTLPVEIQTSNLKNDAGILGAAAIVIEKIC